MPSASINGIEIHFDSYGDGFPLLFIHGGFGGLGTGSGGAVPGWVEQFSTHFRVVLYDRRSSGRSEFPATPHSMDQFADDACGVLDHLDIERAHVWGQSAGGQITLAFGLRHPDRAQSLVITDSAPCLSRDPELLGRLRERIEVLHGQGAEAAYAARRESGTVGLNLFAGARPKQSAADEAARAAQADRIRKQLAAIPRAERIHKYASELRTYEAYANFDGGAALGNLAVPTLVQYGTAETVFPDARWSELSAGNPAIQYREFAGADHGLAASRPESIDEVDVFLGEHC